MHPTKNPIPRRVLLLIGLALFTGSCSIGHDTGPIEQPLPEGNELMKRAHSTANYKDQALRIEAEVTDQGGTPRKFVIETYRRRGPDGTYSLSQVVQPERGNALLSSETSEGTNNVTYMPGFGKFFEVPSTQEDPTFGMTIQESLSEGNLYDYRTQSRTNIDGEEAYVVEGRLKPDVDSTLASMLEYLRASDARPLKTEIFNAKGELLRTKRYLDYRQIDGYWLSARTEVENIARTKRISLMVVEAKFDRNLPASMFTREYLKKISPGLK